MRPIKEPQTRKQAKAYLNRSFQAGVAIHFFGLSNKCVSLERLATNHFNSRFVGTTSKAFRPRPANKKGSRIARPPFHWLGWLSLLEVNPRPNLHLPCSVNRAGDSAEVLRSRQSQTAGIRRLKMIKEVSELCGEGCAHALRELDVLSQSRVNIPSI